MNNFIIKKVLEKGVGGAGFQKLSYNKKIYNKYGNDMFFTQT